MNQKHFERRERYTGFQWDGGPVEGFTVESYPCGGRRIRQLYVTHTDTQRRYADVGDWILTNEEGRRRVLTEEEFGRMGLTEEEEDATESVRVAPTH